MKGFCHHEVQEATAPWGRFLESDFSSSSARPVEIVDRVFPFTAIFTQQFNTNCLPRRSDILSSFNIRFWHEGRYHHAHCTMLCSASESYI